MHDDIGEFPAVRYRRAVCAGGACVKRNETGEVQCRRQAKEELSVHIIEGRVSKTIIALELRPLKKINNALMTAKGRKRQRLKFLSARVSISDASRRDRRRRRASRRRHRCQHRPNDRQIQMKRYRRIRATT